MKKIVAFMGSPRLKGNTARMVGEIIRGAADGGARTKVFDLINMDIKPCRACYYCRQNEGCAIKDSMTEVYDSIKDADAVVMGSPVYMFQVTGQMKQLMDRLYPLLSGEKGVYQPRYGVKQTVTVYSQGAPDREFFQGYFAINAMVLNLLGLKVADTLLCAGAVDEDAAAGDAGLMQRAYEIGRKLAE